MGGHSFPTFPHEPNLRTTQHSSVSANPPSPLKVLDLFAGCGGLSHGFEQAGFRVVAANDLFKEAAQTHQANHPHSRFFLGSITDPNVRASIVAHCKEVGCDVIVGGPPCQAYSLAGKRDVDDERGRLFEDYVEMVNALRPKVFVMENVKGLLSIKHDREDLTPEEEAELERFKDLEREQRELRLKRKQNKNTDRIPFSAEDAGRLREVDRMLRDLRDHLNQYREPVTAQIIRRFHELGYRVEFRLLNAADFGVPQKRERVIFIGTRLDVDIRFPERTHADHSGDGLASDVPEIKQRRRGRPPKARSMLPSLFDDGPLEDRIQVVDRAEVALTSVDRLLKPWMTTREAIDDLRDRPEDKKWMHVFSKHKPDFIERLEKTPVGGNVYEGYSDAWYRQPPDEPSRTVKENHGGVFVHYAEPRVMTPRELARLQSFPDDFTFKGSKGKVLKQIGNAVPPLLGKAIGEAIMEMIEEASGEAGS